MCSAVERSETAGKGSCRWLSGTGGSGSRTASRDSRLRGSTDIANLVLEYEPASSGQGNDTLYLPKFQHPSANVRELPIMIEFTVGETVSVLTKKSH
jgi:hypothetical protein